MNTDPAHLCEFAVDMALEAGRLLMEGYGKAHDPERKGRIDLVTEYDRRSEQLILERIGTRFPDHAVLAEESGTRTGSKFRWIVDPLDGTTNFAHNYPFFSVSIAVEDAQGLAAAVVHDPVASETFAAVRGRGATLNGSAIRASNVDRVIDALLVTGFPYDVKERPERSVPQFVDLLTRAQGIRRDGSAALNLAYLGCGRFDGFWERDLSAWDVAAGALIVREAGGRLTDYAGGPFVLDDREILATNGLIHEEMKEILAAAAAKA